MTYYALVIDTDQYAGNFEREMATYCTDLVFPRGDEYRTGEVEHAEWWEENTYEHYNGEWDEGCAIWITPGWSNNGTGQHTRLGPDEKRRWPAYMSVAIFCGEQPPAEVIEEVRERAKEFSAVYQQRAYGSQKGMIINVDKIRLVAIEKTVTETEIDVG